MFVEAAKHDGPLSQHFWLLPSHTVTKANEERHATSPGPCVSLCFCAPLPKPETRRIRTGRFVFACLFVFQQNDCKGMKSLHGRRERPPPSSTDLCPKPFQSKSKNQDIVSAEWQNFIRRCGQDCWCRATPTPLPISLDGSL